MAVKKLDHIKNIKYSGVHPLDKKKLIKKINNHIDDYNKYSVSIFKTLKIEEYSEIFSNYINEKITGELAKEIANYTLNSPKSNLKYIEENALIKFQEITKQLKTLKDVIDIVNKESLFNSDNLLLAINHSLNIFEKLLKTKKKFSAYSGMVQKYSDRLAMFRSLPASKACQNSELAEIKFLLNKQTCKKSLQEETIDILENAKFNLESELNILARGEYQNFKLQVEDSIERKLKEIVKLTEESQKVVQDKLPNSNLLHVLKDIHDTINNKKSKLTMEQKIVEEELNAFCDYLNGTRIRNYYKDIVQQTDLVTDETLKPYEACNDLFTKKIIIWFLYLVTEGSCVSIFMPRLKKYVKEKAETASTQSKGNTNEKNEKIETKQKLTNTGAKSATKVGGKRVVNKKIKSKR